MCEKGFRSVVGLVMITAAAGCDNVAFGGVQIDLVPPPAAAGTALASSEGPLPVDSIGPLEIGPLLYLVERSGGSDATIIPLAVRDGGAYAPLPDPASAPRFEERFRAGRWEPGAEFTVFAQGTRAGTFVVAGVGDTDVSTCRARPRAPGRIELRAEASDATWFIALAEGGDAPGEPPVTSGPLLSGLIEDGALRNAALNLAQRLIPEMGIPWPPTIPEIRRDLQPLVLEAGGPRALAVSYVYGDGLVVGPPTPLAYSLFIVAEDSGGGRYEPTFAWYHRFDTSGKAFPRLLASHAPSAGAPEAVVEIFGESARGLGILGVRDGRWTVLYDDGCGAAASDAGLRTFP